MKDELLSYINNTYSPDFYASAAEQITRKIESVLNSSGIMYRLFKREKSKESVYDKIERKYDYYINSNKRMQDVIGIRLILYFKDDIAICIRMLNDAFEEDNHEFDSFDEFTFKPLRINYVFRIPENIVIGLNKDRERWLIDDTFEVQLRTTFTEGWQEVEHDIRYKFKDDWNNALDMSRDLNALSAVLEMCDNNIVGICDNLSYRKYKDRDVESMMRNRFRLRFNSAHINDELNAIILSDYDNLGKTIFRFDRMLLIWLLYKSEIEPSYDNVIFIINHIQMKNEKISKLSVGIDYSCIDKWSNDYITKKNTFYDSIVPMDYT